MSGALVIQWRVGNDAWQHGKTVEAWVGEDKAALAGQRQAVRDQVRATEFVPDGGRVQTRVVTEAEAWA